MAYQCLRKIKQKICYLNLATVLRWLFSGLHGRFLSENVTGSNPAATLLVLSASVEAQECSISLLGH